MSDTQTSADLEGKDLVTTLAHDVAQIIRLVGVDDSTPTGRPDHPRMAYEMRVKSDILWPPVSTNLKDATSDQARRLAEDLELVASIPGLSLDTRGVAYLVLERLAHAGVAPAWQVLRSCLRWETHEDLVREAARALSRCPDPLGRDDVVLAILKSDLPDDQCWPLRYLREDDAPVRLLHYVRQLTASALERLPSGKRAQELAARMTLAVSQLSTSAIEVVLREGLEVTGIDSAMCGFFRVLDTCQPEIVGVFISLVQQCVREWPRAQRAGLWRLRTMDSSPAPDGWVSIPACH